MGVWASRRGRARPASAPAVSCTWLRRHHATAAELLVGFYKRAAGKPGVTWPESVDEALCYGWIDGIRKRVDELSYTIRFTPRRAGADRAVCPDAGAQCRGTEVLPRPDTLVPPGGDLVGAQ